MSKSAKLYRDLIRAIQDLGGNIPCTENPDYWDDEQPGMDFTTRQSQISGAKALCRACPVMMMCAEYALSAHEPTGVWGGYSSADREKMLTSK